MLFQKLYHILILSATAVTAIAVPDHLSNPIQTSPEILERSPNPLYTAVYAQGDPGDGIGGFNLLSPSDRALPFDYNGVGKADHLVFYRPGTGLISIIQNSPEGTFTPVFTSTNGIGGYDLQSPADRIFAFDYNHRGLLDHLVLYRPGSGIIFILTNNNGVFSPVFAVGDGIGGYDLESPLDMVLAFDYNHSGLLDHLVLCRPGSGIIFILTNTNGIFSAVFESTNGIGGYDLAGVSDEIFAFDYNHIGLLDHLVLYRPGAGAIFILANNNGLFSAVFAVGAPGNGIAGYDLQDLSDRMFALDFSGTGRLDFIAAYRPGNGTFWIIGNVDGFFVSVYSEGIPGNGGGIGGYDLLSPADVAFAFDFESVRSMDFIVLMRPGNGAIFIVGR